MYWRERGLDVKRIVDVVIAAVALVVLMPVLLVVAVSVSVFLGRPVFFTQVRAGRSGRPFRILKFRTMLDVDEAAGRVDDADRLTRFGNFLRSTSLDELPGLVNVLAGDMSIVGPRPLPVAYLDHYSEVQARRHEVRPGITGLAQVRGRNAADWDERLRWDVEYVESVGLGRDLSIVLSTVGVVIRRQGVSAPGHVTCGSFIEHRALSAVSS